MQLHIGEKIKRFRRERNLTQEEVAAHLGVSFQSISKWERNEGYPDITMLPALANYFSVSVDELIGMQEMASEARLEEINAEWKRKHAAGLHRDNIALMREALKLYPNHALLLVQLSTSLERLDGTKEEKRRNLEESIAVQEQILRACEDSEVRGATLFNICFSYQKVDRMDKALEYARKLPNLYKARENALVYFLPEGEAYEMARAALDPLAWSIQLHLSKMAEVEGNKRYYKRITAIFDLLFDGEEDEFVRALREKVSARIEPADGET